jgi:hypothetical protein
MNNILETHTNKADGLTAFVTETEKGFLVSLRDDDAMIFVPHAQRFPTRERASAEAQKIVS